MSRNTCGCEDHPLLRTINRELRTLEDGSQDCNLSGNYRMRRIELSPRPHNGCSKGNFARVGGACDKYELCVAGQYEEHQCLQGLHWSRVR